MQAAGAALALGAVCVGAKAQDRIEGRGAPNILFMMADDMGWADLSCYGRRDYATPNLDRLASEGVRFLNAYANSAVCSPTRFALITGRYHQRLAGGLAEPLGMDARDDAVLGLPPSHPTLPSRLKAGGYRTSLVGKWHLGFLPNFSPLRSGYDSFFGAMGGGLDYFSHLDTHTEKDPLGLYEGERPVKADGYLTDLIADRAVREIGEFARGSAPFFMSLHWTAPHWPWEGPEDRAISERLRANLMHFEGGSPRTYARMVENLDANVGKVLAALKAAGLADNTIVVFTSDNGGERYSDVWPFRGRKTELLEGGVRTPLIVRWPGVAPRVDDGQVIASMDWAPTLLAAANGAGDPAYPFDGLNLMAQVRGEASAIERDLFWRYGAWDQKAMRRGRWKYLAFGKREHLFDLAEDPQERANLRRVQPEIFARMKAAYGAWDKTMLPYPPNHRSHKFMDDETAAGDPRG